MKKAFIAFLVILLVMSSMVCAFAAESPAASTVPTTTDGTITYKDLVELYNTIEGVGNSELDNLISKYKDEIFGDKMSQDRVVEVYNILKTALDNYQQGTSKASEDPGDGKSPQTGHEVPTVAGLVLLLSAAVAVIAKKQISKS